MNQNTRINLTDNLMSAMVKLAGSNPGAMTALMSLMKDAPIIDPQSAMGELSPLLSLDSHGIYGTDIYVLWSDICGQDNSRVLAVLRAVQLGFFPEEKLVDACSRQDYSGREIVPVEELYDKIKERLEEFDRTPIK